MKKQLFLCFLLLTIMPTIVLAQGKKQDSQQAANQLGEQQKIQDPTLHKVNDSSSLNSETKQPKSVESSTELNTKGNSEEKILIDETNISSQKLNRIAERVNDPEIGEQIRSMVENNQQLQTRIQTATQAITQRSAFKKFFLGADYKNIGQVRSNLVDLKNNISELEKMKENFSSDETETIQIAIDELQMEVATVEAQLTEEAAGFSLFGWLIEKFNK